MQIMLGIWLKNMKMQESLVFCIEDKNISKTK